MQTVSQKESSLRFDWMFGQRADLLFFFLPVVLALAIFYGLEQAHALSLAVAIVVLEQAFGLGAFHQGATWFHFFDKVNRSQYLGDFRKFSVYMGIPMLLFAGTVVSDLFFPAFTFFLYICWSLNHAVQQNIGVLLLYHNGRAGEAVVPRPIEAWSQRWAAIFFSLLYADRVLLKHSLTEPFWYVLIAGSGLIALGAGVAYCLELAKQVKQEKHVNVPAFAFWLLCMVYLLPFAFLGKNYGDAILIPLVVHWCQYIGINWILAERKYSGELTRNLPISKPMLLMTVVGIALIAVSMSLGLTASFTEEDNMVKRLCVGIVLGLGMMHYYMDGYIWKFRDQFPRETMLPYLVRKKS